MDELNDLSALVQAEEDFLIRISLMLLNHLEKIQTSEANEVLEQTESKMDEVAKRAKNDLQNSQLLFFHVDFPNPDTYFRVNVIIPKPKEVKEKDVLKKYRLIEKKLLQKKLPIFEFFPQVDYAFVVVRSYKPRDNKSYLFQSIVAKLLLQGEILDKFLFVAVPARLYSANVVSSSFVAELLNFELINQNPLLQ